MGFKILNMETGDMILDTTSFMPAVVFDYEVAAYLDGGDIPGWKAWVNEHAGGTSYIAGLSWQKDFEEDVELWFMSPENLAAEGFWGEALMKWLMFMQGQGQMSVNEAHSFLRVSEWGIAEELE